MNRFNQGALPEAIVKLLNSRDLFSDQEICDFLYPKLSMLPRPQGLKGAREAAETVCDYIVTGRSLIIWGDYDVDGTTGTSLLVNFFRELGVEAEWHIPDRLAEGYGLNSDVFKEKFSDVIGADFLLITVDCGVSDRSHVDEISSLGGRVIVTDHHQLPLGGLPDCIVVNPSQGDCGFNDQCLAGVGVAFYLAASIREKLSEDGYFECRPVPNLKKYLGFVALGTIADLVEMTRANRILVRAGLEALEGTSIPGLRALLESSGITGGTITTEDVSFGVGPRINAAGRLGKAEAAVGLMTCDNLAEGERYSRKLGQYNVERRTLCDKTLELALNQLEGVEGGPAICVAGDFHQGVVGIVASKLVEKFRKPTIVFSRLVSDSGAMTYKGSGRSVEGVSILECLHESSESIVRYGGHAMAAGLSVNGDLYDLFVKSFQNSVRLAKLNSLHSAEKKEELIDCPIDIAMRKDFLDCFLLMEPFGPQNQRPVFVDREALVVNVKRIGSGGQHLQLTLRGTYKNYEGVAFGFGDLFADVKRQRQREMHFVPMLNRFRGSADWRIRVVSM